MKTTEKSPPDLAEIGRLAVQEYLADRAYVDFASRWGTRWETDELTIQRGRELHAAKLVTELATEDAIFDYLSASASKSSQIKP